MLADAYHSDIQRIARGDVTNIPPALRREEQAWRRTLLSSSPAEGYHRSQRLFKVRGSAARTPWSFSSGRLPQSLAIMEDIEEHSKNGLQCFAAEYRSCSRVLQTQPGTRIALRVIFLEIYIHIFVWYAKLFFSSVNDIEIQR